MGREKGREREKERERTRERIPWRSSELPAMQNIARADHVVAGCK